MALSRGLSLLRMSKFLNKPAGTTIQVRNSGGLYSYRCAGYPPSKNSEILATTITGVMWWWIFWHLFTEPELIYGEFPYPDPSEWTDQELGIPPDNE